jgi:hypothetical protein
VDDPDARAFYEGLARTHRVVRHDRLGADFPPCARAAADPETEAAQLAAVRRVHRWGGHAVRLLVRRARHRPARDRSAGAGAQDRLFGGYASRDDIPDATDARSSTSRA